MATFNAKRGWEWTDEERQERQVDLRQARRLLDNVREQVRRVGLHVTQFKARAEEALRHLENGLKDVVGIDLSNRGAKYKPVSPKEADRVLGTLKELMKPWQDFISSPDVVAASRVKNREIRAYNAVAREHNKAVEAQTAEVMRKFNDVLRKVDAGDVNGALDDAAEMGIL